jgi:phosphoribosylformylglycinamidine cyclo-ligase
MTAPGAYTRAGVDVAAGERAVELMSRWLGSGAGEAVGRFASVMEIPAGMERPVIVSATDGVGTKSDIARRVGRLDTIGQDLVAMCADDVVCHGATPSYFLDYLAVGSLEPERVATLVGGIAQACAQIGCSLVGGETAEHPGLMAEDEFDLAGFCIGFVERGAVIDSSDSQPGDAIVGLASSGLHANGFSLIRALLDDGALALGDELLTPTRLYAPVVLELLAALRVDRLRVGGLAHITGGGIARNLPRAVPDGLGVRVDPAAWPQPAIFDQVAKAAGMAGDELRATFNCGVGFAVVLEPAAVPSALELLHSKGVGAWVVGEVCPTGELGGRYAEV